MPELGTYGSVRGAPSDGRPYRDYRWCPVVKQVCKCLYKSLSTII